MRKFLSPLLLLICSLYLPVAVSAEKPLLVTSIRPLSLIAADLAGGWIEVRQLLRNNQEPHHVALTVSQRRLLDEADLVLWVSPALETFLVRPLSRQHPSRAVSLDAVARERVPGATMAGDAHLWLQPDIVRAFYRELAALLMEKYPERSRDTASRLALALHRLDAAVAQITSTLAASPQKAVIVDHQAYGHFTRYFNIELAGAMVNEKGVAVGARSLAQLESRSDVACVVVERMPPPPRAKKLASRLNLRVVPIDPLGGDVPAGAGYVELLENLGRGFAECLSNPRS